MSDDDGDGDKKRMPLQRLLAALPHLPLLSAACLTLLVVLLCLPPLHASAGAASCCGAAAAGRGGARLEARDALLCRRELHGVRELLRGRSPGDYLVRQERGREKAKVLLFVFTLKRDIILLFAQPCFMFAYNL